MSKGKTKNVKGILRAIAGQLAKIEVTPQNLEYLNAQLGKNSTIHVIPYEEQERFDQMPEKIAQLERDLANLKITHQAELEGVQNDYFLNRPNYIEVPQNEGLWSTYVQEKIESLLESIGLQKLMELLIRGESYDEMENRHIERITELQTQIWEMNQITEMVEG